LKKLFSAAICLLLFLGCAQNKGDLSTITVWHWMTDRNVAFQELAKRYEQQTGVKVKIDLFAPSDAYTQKVTASTQAKILPDVYGILDTKKTFADFIRYGYVADLTEEYQKNNAEWEKSIFAEALNSNRFGENNEYGIKPGIYGVPLDVTNLQMLYNKRLLKIAGYDRPPKTFQEFIEVSRALKRVGIPVMVSGWGELWMADCFASNYAFNIMGEDKVMATYRGKVPYTDPDWIKVFTIFKDLTDYNMLIEGIITKPNKEAEQDFALERAAFAFNGSWSVNVYSEMNPDLDYGVMLPPPISSDFPLKIWGGAVSSFVVNNNTPRKEKAVAFLKWLTDKEQQEYLAKTTRNLPSNHDALPAIPKILEEFARGMNHATHPTIWKLNEQPLVTERYTKGLQSIILGKKTPEQVAREVQEIKIREMVREAKRNQ
jgi:ABC-type glycerol-3-phosphate transport system substrate-binding protein